MVEFTRKKLLGVAVTFAIIGIVIGIGAMFRMYTNLELAYTRIPLTSCTMLLEFENTGFSDMIDIPVWNFTKTRELMTTQRGSCDYIQDLCNSFRTQYDNPNCTWMENSKEFDNRTCWCIAKDFPLQLKEINPLLDINATINESEDRS